MRKRALFAVAFIPCILLGQTPESSHGRELPQITSSLPWLNSGCFPQTATWRDLLPATPRFPEVRKDARQQPPDAVTRSDSTALAGASSPGCLSLLRPGSQDKAQSFQLPSTATWRDFLPATPSFPEVGKEARPQSPAAVTSSDLTALAGASSPSCLSLLRPGPQEKSQLSQLPFFAPRDLEREQSIGPRSVGLHQINNSSIPKEAQARLEWIGVTVQAPLSNDSDIKVTCRDKPSLKVPWQDFLRSPSLRHIRHTLSIRIEFHINSGPEVPFEPDNSELLQMMERWEKEDRERQGHARE